MISDYLDRPIAFHRVFVAISGSVTGAVFLSQALYWSKRTTSSDGFFYKTQAEWEEETGLSRREQESVRKRLKAVGILSESLRGTPAKLYYKVELDVLDSALSPSKPDGKRQTSMAESAKLDWRKAPNPHTENTTEITTDINAPRRDVGFVDELPYWIDEALWSDFVEHRKSLRKPLTAKASKLIIDKLAKIRAAGHSPESVLKESIMNGYQGVFMPNKKPAEKSWREGFTETHADRSWANDLRL